MLEFIYNIFCIKRKRRKVVWVVGENDILDTSKTNS